MHGQTAIVTRPQSGGWTMGPEQLQPAALPLRLARVWASERDGTSVLPWADLY